FFFFSSRRRHTRSKRDWSSDVCSSDLYHYNAAELQREAERARALGCEMIVTTEKDAVKIAPEWIGVVPVWVLSVELEFDAGQERSEERRVGKECRGGWWRERGREREVM